MTLKGTDNVIQNIATEFPKFETMITPPPLIPSKNSPKVTNELTCKFCSIKNPESSNRCKHCTEIASISGTLGTANPPYKWIYVNENDQEGVQRYHCITAMKEYSNKSFEELRVEDYKVFKKRGYFEEIGSFSSPTIIPFSTNPFSTTITIPSDTPVFGIQSVTPEYTLC